MHPAPTPDETTRPAARSRAETDRAHEQLRLAIAGVWERSRDAIMAHLEVLELASLAAQHAMLGDDDRRQTLREAHKLAGSLGTFGFAEGSRLAREIEQILEANDGLYSDDGHRFASLVVALREELNSCSTLPSSGVRPREKDAPQPVVADDGALIARSAAQDALRRARMPLAAMPHPRPPGGTRVSPERMVKDVATASGQQDEPAALVGKPAQSRELPVTIRPTNATVERTNRSLGAHGEEATDVGVGMAAPEVGVARPGTNQLQVTATRLLAVDDDPHILDLLRTLLEPSGMEVTTLSDPRRFEDVLSDISPDLLVLDVDMPELTGIDLCTMVRASTRWGDLPVIFLTARTDSTTIKQIFAVGGDDYIAKPIVGPELLARIAVRAERDPLLPRVMVQLYQHRVRAELLALSTETQSRRTGWQWLLLHGQKAIGR